MTPNASKIALENPKLVIPTKNGKRKLFGPYNFLWLNFDHELKYFNIWFLAFLHIFTPYVLFVLVLQKWKLFLFSTVYGITGGFGVTAGVHRYFTHRTYKATTFMKLILLCCYAISGHNKLFEWVRDHRVHHKYSETDADPHNSNRGFFFAHVGWLMMKKHPDVIRKGQTVDMTDIKNDPLLIYYDKYFYIMQIFFCFLLPIFFAHYVLEESWYWSILSQVFGRYVVFLNFTWLVNSAAHLYGRRPYDKTIQPRENAIVSFFSAGEGWHNYHHTFPWDYKTSEFGKSNLTTTVLDLFAKLGLVYDRKSPSDELVRNTILKLGDGSHKEFGCYVDENGQIQKVQN